MPIDVQMFRGVGRGGEGVAQKTKGRLDFPHLRPARLASFKVRLDLSHRGLIEIAQQILGQ